MSDNLYGDVPDIAPGKDGGFTAYDENPEAAFTGENAPETGQDGMILGKFKSYTELERAYKQSERFITESREQLKQAKNELDALKNDAADFRGWTDEAEAAVNEYCTDKREQMEIAIYLKNHPELITTDATLAVLTALGDVRNQREGALRSISESNLPELISREGSGQIITPAVKPKSFDEAGKVLLNMLKKQGGN